MTSRPDHVDVAAYVLGVLDEDEVDAFENHLAQCRRCALDLRDFAVLPDLLDEADANGMLRANAGERPDGRSVRAMLDTVTEDRARRRRTALLLSAAAAVLLIVLTAVTTVALSPSPGGTAKGGPGEAGPPPTVAGLTAVAKNAPDASGTVTGTDQSTGVRARLDATAEPWGTSVSLEVTGVRGPTRCELVATAATGESAVAASWSTGASTADEDPLRLHSSVGLRWHEITEFSIRDTGNGTTLIRLPTA
ncbi:zf-HC2 domain-containing protein [Actinosynnema sp. NPDC023587]|uniref:anti-sigma factor family protein n=1 Tax=Actinosynnema sp. NPDC023587 TaxID=3154695 RepID=UPI0033E8E16F